MLSFLLLVSTSGQPLPAQAVARLAPVPDRGLAFVPAAMTTWRSEGDHVALVAWSDRAAPWHLGRHGVTLATGHPWPLASRFTAPGGVAMELTDRLGDGDDPGRLAWLTGDTVVVRVRPDGTGVVAAPPLGGGGVVVAEGDGLLAVADRPEVAAAGVGGVVRTAALPDLLTGSLLGDRTGCTGVDRLGPGAHVRLRGRGGATVVAAPTPWHDLDGASVEDLLPAAADDVVRLLGLAAEHAGPRRTVELGAGPGARVLAAALAAAGRHERFALRAAAGPANGAAATALAARLGVALEPAVPLGSSAEDADERLRAAVGRIGASVAPTVLAGGALAGAGSTGEGGAPHGLVVPLQPSSVLAPVRRGDVALLRSEQAAALAVMEDTWRAALPRGTTAPERAVLDELERHGPRAARAAADLAAGADVLDPLAVPSLARLALVAARDGVDAAARLVATLHPPLAAQAPPRPDGAPAAQPDAAASAPLDAAPWRALATVVEAHVAGQEALAEVLDTAALTRTARRTDAPDPATVRALEGALALAVWASGSDVHAPVRPPAPTVRVTVQRPAQAPVLVTGITSRPLLELAATGVPLDEVEVDALLGVRVDREARDLVHRLLLAAGATPGHLPADLDDRLAGAATAPLAEPAAALLARRGGTLVEPRLALTLPFWLAHVGRPRVLLVAERPPDLAARSPALLPPRELLGWWVDAVTAAAASGADVRVVDPGDLLELDEAEASAWEGLGGDRDDADLVRVARTVDSLVREVELEAARPLLRTIRRSRAGVAPGRAPTAPGAAVPLRVVDDLWERAVSADEALRQERTAAAALQERLTAAEREAEDLRERRGLKAAWRVLTGG